MRPLHLPNFALCFALAILAPGWVSAEERPAIAVSAEQIEEWITSLDSNQYDVRQRAQEQLEIAALPAVEAVAVVAQSLERLFRKRNTRDQRFAFLGRIEGAGPSVGGSRKAC